MGLDVYLYRYDEDFAVVAAREAEAEKFSEATWERVGAGRKYEDMTDAQKDAAREETKAHNIALGLDEWGTDETHKVKVEIDSAKYPEHYFKVGYFRSSYNESGINRIAHNLIGMSLGDIFNAGDDYIVRPDWTLAREAAVNFLDKLKAAPRLRVSCIGALPLLSAAPNTSEADALSVAATETTKDRVFEGGYSSSAGHFFPKGFKIVAAIPGVDTFKRPAVHLVYEDEGFDWYIQAAEIVIETIDYVLAQNDPSKFALHWSG